MRVSRRRRNNNGQHTHSKAVLSSDVSHSETGSSSDWRMRSNEAIAEEISLNRA